MRTIPSVAAILAFACGLCWFGLQVAMTTCTNPKLKVAYELEYRVVKLMGLTSGGPPTEELNCGSMEGDTVEMFLEW